MNIKELAKKVKLTEADSDGIWISDGHWVEELTRFAELVAAHEREECAKVCDAHGLFMTAQEIRARSKT
jgi:hypothetical protein